VKLLKKSKFGFKIGKQFLESKKPLEEGQIWATFGEGYQLVKIRHIDNKSVTADSPYIDAKLLNDKLEFVRDVIVDMYSLHEVRIYTKRKRKKVKK
jgi:hypothetical protein